jgi:hypothetical protein
MHESCMQAAYRDQAMFVDMLCCGQVRFLRALRPHQHIAHAAAGHGASRWEVLRHLQAQWTPGNCQQGRRHGGESSASQYVILLLTHCAVLCHNLTD